MNQNAYTPPAPQPEAPKRNTTLIVIIVLLVLCCLCALVVALGWQFGDAIMNALGVTY
ncbi:MAG TPA: hypothetical protein VFH29_06160 [Anaerolineales bacterium]|nr:hypothetical protein [Anaerolineales bacterium]